MIKKSRIKIAFLVIGVCVFLFVVGNIVTYLISRKNIIEYFNRDEDKFGGIWNELEQDGSQSVTIDEYMITLEAYLYDNETETGYIKFSIRREGFDMRKDEAGETGGFGIIDVTQESPRFMLRVNGSGSYTVNYKKERDVMYMYYKYAMTEGDKIYLYDKNTDELTWLEKGNEVYRFELQDNVKTNKYVVTDEGSKFYMSLTSFSMYIKKTGYIGRIEELTIYYNNGEKYVLIKDGCASKGISVNGSSENNINTYGLNFKKSISLDNISYISYNNKKIELIDKDKEIG